MLQKARINTRINPELKKEAEDILYQIGIKPSQAITIFYAQIIRHKGIPFELKLSNKQIITGLEKKSRPGEAFNELLTDFHIDEDEK